MTPFVKIVFNIIIYIFHDLDMLEAYELYLQEKKVYSYGRQLPGPITLQKVVISYQSLKSHNSLNFKDRD